LPATRLKPLKIALALKLISPEVLAEYRQKIAEVRQKQQRRRVVHRVRLFPPSRPALVLARRARLATMCNANCVLWGHLYSYQWVTGEPAVSHYKSNV
jgi:hypothetical protein